MKRLILGMVMLMAANLLMACGSTKEDLTWERYASKDIGISFEYPATWKLITDTEGKVAPQPEVLVIDPSTAENDFTANINLLVQQSLLLAPSAAEQAETAEKFFELFGQASGMKDYSSLEFEPVKIGRSEAGILTMEFTMSQNNLRVRAKQLIVPVGQQTFILTGTAQIATWAKYEPIFDQVLKSFRLE